VKTAMATSAAHGAGQNPGERARSIRANVYTGVERRRLDPQLMTPSRMRGYLQVVGNIGVFTTLLFFASAATSPWLFVVLYLAIGFALHRLFFPLHDCMHYSLFPTKIENRVCGALLSALLGTSFDAIREQHMDHHRDFGTENDPGAGDYFVRFRSRKELLTFLLGPLVGSILFRKVGDYLLRPRHAATVLDSRSARVKPTLARQVVSYGVILCIQLGVCAILTDGLQIVQLWRYMAFNVLPAVTSFLCLNRLRMFLEHGSLDYAVCDYFEHRRPTARSIYGSWLERILLCGSNFNFHHEHHLYPAVPGWQLPRLHRQLLVSGLDAEDVRRSYFEAFCEIWRNSTRSHGDARSTRVPNASTDHG
jgi:fatty acid desaturase